VRAVVLSLVVLAATAVAQALVFLLSGSVALLADLIHNVGDALTALPVGFAFLLRSARAERLSGLAVVFAITVSACVAAFAAVDRLIDPLTPRYLVPLVLSGLVGFAGNWVAAGIRTAAGHRLQSAALVADGHHARADAYVSLAVVGSSALVAAGLEVADPLLGLGISALIFHIAWESWQTVQRG
jgi:cation diffusion facilitator family transporter